MTPLPWRKIQVWLSPSIFSMNTCIGLALAILAVGNWAYAAKNSPVYDYFFGPYGIVTRITYWVQTTTESFNLPWVYYVLVTTAAIACGVVVYIVLGRIGAGANEVRQTVEEVTLADTQSRPSVLREVGAQLALRTVFTVLWVGFVLLSAGRIVPQVLGVTQVFIDDPFNLSAVMEGLGTVLVLLLCLHVHVVALRLIALRPRVFGGRRDLFELWSR